MSDSYCDVYDKTNKLKIKKKHLNTRSHRASFMSMINRYCVKNQQFIKVEYILKNTLMIIKKRFEFYYILYEWKLDIVDTFICVNSPTMYNIQSVYDLRSYFITKIGYFNRRG